MVAAEASGDRLAAEVVARLRERGFSGNVRGLAGPRMREAGVVAVAHSEAATAIGLWEAVGALPRIARVWQRLQADLAAHPDSLVFTIDSPELTTRLGKRARRRGHRVVHWVAPQVWAWRPGRARHIGRSFDTVLCLLPFEPELLAEHVHAVFTGHPAAAVRPGARVRPGSPAFALVPGSRASEIRRHWPVLCEVARRLRRRHPAAGFVVVRAPSVPRAALTGLDAVLVDDISDVAAVDAAVVASGTATVELAALGVPMVVVYRVHPATHAVVRRLVR
ncbi:MAG: lipid-A-disaccharide synthase, partial [Myxococcota bacterium]